MGKHRDRVIPRFRRLEALYQVQDELETVELHCILIARNCLTNRATKSSRGCSDGLDGYQYRHGKNPVCETMRLSFSVPTHLYPNRAVSVLFANHEIIAVLSIYLSTDHHDYMQQHYKVWFDRLHRHLRGTKLTCREGSFNTLCCSGALSH